MKLTNKQRIRNEILEAARAQFQIDGVVDINPDGKIYEYPGGALVPAYVKVRLLSSEDMKRKQITKA